MTIQQAPPVTLDPPVPVAERVELYVTQLREQTRHLTVADLPDWLTGDLAGRTFTQRRHTFGTVAYAGRPHLNHNWAAAVLERTPGWTVTWTPVLIAATGAPGAWAVHDDFLPGYEPSPTTPDGLHLCHCGTTWTTGTASLPFTKTSPAEFFTTRPSRVPVEDIYGNQLGNRDQPGYRRIRLLGDSVPVGRDADQGQSVITYRWPCGDHETTLVRPASDRIECQDGAPKNNTATGCFMAAQIKHPPSDLYVNPRYGGACDCCGHDGSHWVSRIAHDLPRCLRAQVSR